jgi:hypothetical protein
MDWSYTLDLPSFEFNPMYGNVNLGSRTSVETIIGQQMGDGSVPNRRTWEQLGEELSDPCKRK